MKTIRFEQVGNHLKEIKTLAKAGERQTALRLAQFLPVSLNVQGKNVVINGDWKWYPDLINPQILYRKETMRSLIIPDIHNKTQKADEIIKASTPDEVIFLGDYFDSLGDNPEMAEQTARWLKNRLYLPGYFFILGNHDAGYRWPKCPWMTCTGYKLEKQERINKVLTQKDWEKTLFAVERGTWWLSHAGLHPNIFCHPIMGFDPKRVWSMLHEAEFKGQANIHSPILDEKRAEGDAPSGPLWLRWNEFEPITNVNQIVGHTWQESPQWKNTEDSKNLNLDTHLEYYAILEDGEVTTHPAPQSETNPPPRQTVSNCYRNN